MKILCFSLLSITTFASCDYGYRYTYEVTNNTDTTIEVHLRTRYLRGDSVVALPAMARQVVYETSHGVEGRTGPYYRKVAVDLDSFYIIKRQDTATPDYLRDSCWKFTKSGPNGIYATEVTNGNF